MREKKYTFDQAKELYIKMTNEQDPVKKKELKDDLITGTLYVVKNFVEKNYSNIKTSGIDSDDIYSIAYEGWISLINEGYLLKVNYFNTSSLESEIRKRLNNYLPLNDMNVEGANSILNTDMAYIIEKCYKIYKTKDLNDEDIYSAINEVLGTNLSIESMKKEKKYYNYCQIIKSIVNYINDQNIDIKSTTDVKRLINVLKIEGAKSFHHEIAQVKNSPLDYEEDFAEEAVDKVDLLNLVDELLTKHSLTEQETIVLIKRFGLKGELPLSYEDIGKIMGLTEQKVRQIETKALKKLKQHFYFKKWPEQLLQYYKPWTRYNLNSERKAKKDILRYADGSPKIISKKIINNQIKELNGDDDIIAFINERIADLSKLSDYHRINENKETECSDYISNKVTYSPFISDKIWLSGHVSYDYIELYHELLKQIVDRKKGVVELYLFEDLFYKLYGLKNNDKELTEEDKAMGYFLAVSIEDVIKKNVCTEFEIAGLAHNFMKIIGLDSRLVIGEQNNESHSYILLYPNGYESGRAVLFDPSLSLRFDNENGESKYMGAFKILTPKQYDGLISGKEVTINFAQSAHIYKQYYDALNGYELKDKFVCYGLLRSNEEQRRK